MRGSTGNPAQKLGGGDEHSSRMLESNYRSLCRLHVEMWSEGEKWTPQLIWSPIIQFVVSSHRFTPIFSPRYVYFIQYRALLWRLTNFMMLSVAQLVLQNPEAKVTSRGRTFYRFRGCFVCENVDLRVPTEAPRCSSSSSPPPPSSSPSHHSQRTRRTLFASICSAFFQTFLNQAVN